MPYRAVRELSHRLVMKRIVDGACLPMGEVNICAFMAKLELEAISFAGTMAIGREAGSTRVADIVKAIRGFRAY